MAKKKVPWRTVIRPEGSGRFTEEQIRDAVRAVKERNEKRAAQARKRASESGREAGDPRNR
ncbi:hypothetical protein [Longimicrobium sp.]|uniref:hypothetical protein n=1 Tax=Longimicrobium sp. TaxID=2029185 RepID=UPI002BDF0E00|nr:hypothetical protein [Longimicrobium sp.]HSU17917.1 hypothetical protein [Longimicrobium sp.]